MIYSELGLTDDARKEFEELSRHDFANLPSDVAWLGTMSYLLSALRKENNHSMPASALT